MHTLQDTHYVQIAAVTIFPSDCGAFLFGGVEKVCNVLGGVIQIELSESVLGVCLRDPITVLPEKMVQKLLGRDQPVGRGRRRSP